MAPGSGVAGLLPYVIPANRGAIPPELKFLLLELGVCVTSDIVGLLKATTVMRQQAQDSQQAGHPAS